MEKEAQGSDWPEYRPLVMIANQQLCPAVSEKALPTDVLKFTVSDEFSPIRWARRFRLLIIPIPL